MMADGVQQGQFITLEGGEGSGKSTQSRRLVERLSRLGLDVIATREPGGAPGADEIRNLLVRGDTGRWDPLTETLLLFAARRQHLAETVWPALAAGQWVVSDRFADSTMAYQGYAQGVGREAVERVQVSAIGDFLPNLTLILDLPVEVGLARAAQRTGGEDRYERMGLAFHRRLHDAYRDIAAREPNRCKIIDATQDLDAVTAGIWTAVASHFKLPQ